MTCSRSGIEHLDRYPLVRDLLFGKLDDKLLGWRERLQDLRALGLANVQEVLQLGIKQGLFRAEMDVEICASLLQDLQIATYLFHVPPTAKLDERLERRARAAFDLILNGLRAHPAPGGRG